MHDRRPIAVGPVNDYLFSSIFVPVVVGSTPTVQWFFFFFGGEGIINIWCCHYKNDMVQLLACHTDQNWVNKTKTNKKSKQKIKSYHWRWICYEQFENWSRLGVLSDRESSPYICMLGLTFRSSVQIHGGWLVNREYLHEREDVFG